MLRSISPLCRYPGAPPPPAKRCSPARPRPPAAGSPTVPQVPEHLRPAPGRLSARVQRLPPPCSRHSRRHHHQRGLLPLQAGLHVDPVHPHVDHLKVVQGPRTPFGKLGVPLVLEAGDRARRYRRVLSEQSPQRQVEVALRETVQVQLRDQVGNLPRLWTNRGSRVSNLSSVSRIRGLLIRMVPELRVSRRGGA